MPQQQAGQAHSVDIDEYNSTAVALPELPLHDLFTAQAARTPEAAALLCGEVELSYGQLDAASDAFARRLVAAGVRPGDRLGLLFDRSVEYVVAMLGVLKAGGAYVPLDARQPEERLSWMLRDTGAVLLLTDRRPGGTDFAGDLPVVRVGAEIAVVEGESVPLGLSVAAGQAAYVMYTSGSSGTPKGVVNTHRNVVELALDPWWASGRHRRVLAYSPLAFDSSTYELWVPLLSGGLAVILPAAKIDLGEIAEAIIRHEATAAYFTTALFDAMAHEAVDSLGRLEEIWTGGDVLSRTALEKVLAHCPGTTVVHAYGPTEATVFCSYQVFAPDTRTVERLHLGGPMANTAMYVLDERLRPTAPGAAGELYVAGSHLAAGYLGRAALTAERFTANPFGPSGSRMYRTGDLARWNHRGEIEFLGRVDQQVKLRGFRIELGEIETVLSRRPEVGQAAVVVREDRPGDKRLVAYVVPVAGSETDPEALRRYVEGELPEYMVPSAFVRLDALPLTANGKLDRRALPEPVLGGGAAGRAARTPVEEILCTLFAEALGLPSVAVDDDFFRLGGHSLLATRLVCRLRALLGTRLSLTDFFRHPTAALLAGHLAGAVAEDRPALVPAERGDTVPLSPAQRRLWFLDQMEGPSATYNIPLAVRVRGGLDREALRGALSDVVARHEVLRTVYPAQDGTPYQSVLPAESVDLSLPVVPATEDALGDTLGELAGSVAFDLARDLPVRGTLLELAPDDHVLLLVVHHIASDGWSNTPLMRDLGAAYAARADGVAPGWQPLPVQYADYTLWQQELLGDADDPDSVLAAQLDYWQGALAELPDTVSLPADRPRPVVASYRGATHTVSCPAALHQALTALARESGTTFFMVAQAAVAALLTRSGAGTDIALGSLVAGRGDEALDDLVGFFVNTLVLRTDTGGDPSFRELLRRARETDLAAWAHQDVPFDRLVEALNPERSASRHPLFQVMLTVADAVDPAPVLPGADTSASQLPLDAAKFDLTVNFHEHHTRDGGPAGLDITIEYATDLYDAVTMRAAAARLVRLLGAAVAEPETPIGRIELLGETERAALLVDYNDTETDLPAASLPELFAAQAARTPEAVALVCGEAELSYRQLDAVSDAFARRLVAAGVRPGGRVGLFLDRSVEYVVAMLGVLKAGGAYVPLDARQPGERLSWMLRDTGAVLLVTDRGADATEFAGGLPVVRVGAEIVVVEGESAPLGLSVAAGQAAYVMYTSGSSGTPKGVVNTHRNVVELALDPWWASGRHRRVLAYSPLAFDSSTYELWVPLLSGGLAVILPAAKIDLGEIAEAIIRHEATAAYFTTALFDAMAHEAVDSLGRLEEIWTGGDVLSATALRTVLDRCPDTTVVHAYGPTEATVFCSYQVFATDARTVERLHLGGPMANTAMYVLDDRFRPAPPGVTGELYVSGSHLAAGYFGRPALTAERFTANPYGPSGSRMYRTGDLARWNRHGEIEFLGRADQQVKLRGFRIELGEIETVLSRRPEVGQAAVVVREDRPGDKRLVAYVVPVAGSDSAPDTACGIDPEALRRYTVEALPEYMVPSAFVTLDALPLTANGKLDRRALPAPVLRGSTGGQAARTPAEQVLCTLFAEALGLASVAVDDDFFRLGGHSLLATRLVARVREIFGAQVLVRDLFRHPTATALAAHIAGGQDDATRPALTAGSRPARLPLSPSQQRLWFLDQMEGPSATYNIPLAIRLTGGLDRDALRGAVSDVVARHEALRTLFPAENGEPYQRIVPADRAEVPFALLGADEDTLAARMADEAGRPFVLDSELPLRTVLFELAPDEHVLLLVMHHIVSDGWSSTPLTRDLGIAYGARADGVPPDWEPLPVQYADYTLWQQELLGDADDPESAVSTQLDYWKGVLEGLPDEVSLPADRPRPVVASYRGATHTVSCPAALHQALTALARETGTTFFMVAQAAVAALLTRSGAGTDIAIGAPVAGRADQALDDLVGFFVNTLVLRTDTGGDPSFRELLRRARDTDLAAWAHQDVPFDRLVEALNPERSTSRQPLAQVMLSVTDAAVPVPQLPGVVARSEFTPLAIAKFDLTFTFREHRTPGGEPAGFDLGVEYATDLYDAGTIEAAAARLTRLLDAAAGTPDLPAGELDMLGDEERRRLLVTWNGETTHRAGASLPEAFAARVAREPDAPAVVMGGRSLSYTELDERTDRLARRLLGEGIRAGDPVVLFLERSLEAVVALLAVVKTGAVYVPLDVRYPADRIALIVRDSKATVFLTDRDLTGLGLPEHARTIPVTGVADRPRGTAGEAAAGSAATGRAAAGGAEVGGADPLPPVHPDQPAYAMFTSGSTGVPKGVAVTHRNITDLAADERFPLASRARMLLHSPMAFDASTFEFWMPLLTGGTLVVAPPGLLDTTAMSRVLSEGRITGLVLSSGLFQMLAEDDPAALAGVRTVLTGGDVMSVEAVRRIHEHCPDTTVLNGYGPTETTVLVAAHTVRRPYDRPGAVPIGTPLDNTRMYVLDSRMRLVPPMTPGELYLAGSGLATGYPNRPALTAERFTADPYGPPGSRMYRTGDLARWNHRGEIEFLGRADQQVKLRGFRIEPGEIETALCRHPAVAQAAVVLGEIRAGDKALIAYVTPFEGVHADSAELRAQVSATLPDYMVPSAFVQLDALPLTANGKLDRGALPAPEPADTGAAAEGRAPRTPNEEMLCGLFAELLGRPSVSIDDNFFHLGGHSLLATRLVRRINSVMGVDLPIGALFNNPMVATLVEQLDRIGSARPKLRPMRRMGAST
ncbi:amino acid adenylation domain-containing protein [Streptomyces sp. SID8366]|uniref:non-ribosomal peptide synthetase n=3 Tax=Streptomyces TaxID=1883 RepID=UPI000DB8FCE9|nr:non-ribosomal peptide synthetase [Streptomyces sp. PsTaAH-130]MYU05335.1 amino acid adenylation domain-containing protein [Streptomyces sp. SID8366]RAJ66218.1 amino acid adenylation domain-containing protein [Streptomyces sp. PsTaAH-130]